MHLTNGGFPCKINKYDIVDDLFANTQKGKGSYEKDKQKMDDIVA